MIEIDSPPRRAVKKIAQKSKCRFKLGAVIARGNRVLAKAYNINKTHPKYGSGKFKALHAESAVIYQSIRRGIDLRGTTMYVYRYNDNLAKPCPCCQKLIEKYGIKKVIYSGEPKSQIL